LFELFADAESPHYIDSLNLQSNILKGFETDEEPRWPLARP
jgi:hypothetical protein